VIECESPDPELPAELALPRNAIAKRNTDRPVGTGPFHVVDWQPGKTLTLAAEEDYWRGRPFLDGIQIEMGKSFRDQLTALDLNRTDLLEVAPEQAHRVSLEGRRLINSAPIELFALVFARDAQSPEEKSLREALALCVERASIRSVLLQGAGQATAGVLPYWMSGYDFVFSIDADLARARHAREQARSIPTLSLGYDAGDPTARLLTERIALNAKDAGLSVQPKSGDNADLRLMRIPLASADPWIALAEVDAISAAPALKNKGGTVEDLYAAEQTLLATQRIIPLFHLPVSYAASTAVKGWGLRPDGTLNLADAWLGSAKP
jgi:ABC-type transport system substrate-binding protein